MELSSRSEPRIVPEYSLTGDILSFTLCPLQYRRYNLANLPPSKPVQRWFGEFIHRVMEDSGRYYLRGELSLPVGREDYYKHFHKKVVVPIIDNLKTAGLYPYENQFRRDPFNEGKYPEDYGIAAQRAFEAVNVWGTELFPLVRRPEDFEVTLKGTRRIPENLSARSEYYTVKGVVDIISGVTLEMLGGDSLFHRFLRETEGVRECIERRDRSGQKGEYEIIIEYKGMRRPPEKENGDMGPLWRKFRDQVFTYAWLREKMRDARPVVAGVILFLNELVPSKNDLEILLKESGYEGDYPYRTDIPLPEELLKETKEYIKGKIERPEYPKDFLIKRSILVFPVEEGALERSIENFSRIVGEIENCVKEEIERNRILDVWEPRGDEDTCAACDFLRSCKSPKVGGK